MSYAGSTPRSGASLPSTSALRGEGDRPDPPARGATLRAVPGGPRTESERRPARDYGFLALGIAIGAIIATGATLLYAPQSGDDTRAEIARRGRKLRTRGRDAWDDLRDEFAIAAYKKKRQYARMKRAHLSR